jgi:hypothetical protein
VRAEVEKIGDWMNSFSSTTVAVPSTRFACANSERTVDERSRSSALIHPILFAAISAVIVIPCFWHHRIQAGDLGSHVYNAWLVQLIQRGEAPGLRIAPQWNNVLCDFLLSGLARFFSLDVSARIAASVAVLVFFWGAFAFVYAITRRAPWQIMPLLAAITYGWTFNRGFMNYYLSLGFAFLALAVFCLAKGWKRLLALAFAPIIFLAHPLGLAWLVAAAFYIVATEVVPKRWHPVLLVAAIGAVAVVRVYLLRHFRVDPPSHSALFFNGLDQLLFTNRYAILILMFCAIGAIAFASEVLRQRTVRDWLLLCSIPLQLYVLIEAGIQLLPASIYLPQYAAPIGDLTERLTSISAVLLCCLVAAIPPRRWLLFAFGAVAILFFAFLYQDTGRLDRMEARVEALVHTIPPGQRVLLTIAQPLNYRFSSKHILDIACPGYCFAYGNYEAPTGQFRVRANPENSIVVGDLRDAQAMEEGSYVVPSRVLPLFQIYQCGSAWTDLCIRPLEAGEAIGTAGHHN